MTPSDHDLVAFDRGLLPDDATDAVVRWLEAHPEGEERLRRLTERSPDDAVEALRQPCGIDEEMARLSGMAARVAERLLNTPGRAAPAMPESIRDYRLVRPLGHGGMGHVYLARHLRLQRDVALKLLPAHLAADPSFRTRFEREMAVIGQFDHPNLVSAHDAGVEGDHLFLVMELLDGLDLDAVVDGRGKLAVPDACEAVRQAALGLHHAHQHGIVHRDIKPSNLFLTRTGTVKVIDLGLARAAESQVSGPVLSSVHTVMGTPEFMAPEQWESMEVGPRADLYSLGCTLFYLLTGRPPFVRKDRASWVALMDAHRQQPPPCLRDCRGDVPTGLTELMGRLLAKAPDQRPNSGHDVAQALAQFSKGHNLQGLIGAQTKRQRLAPADVTPPDLDPVVKRRPRWLRADLGVQLVIVLVLAIWMLTKASAPTPDAPDPSAATPINDKPPAPAPTTPVVLQPARTLTRHAEKVLAVAYSPDGKTLASAGADRTILLWDTQTWKVRASLQGHAGDVVALVFAPDGHTLASASSAQDDCEIRIWDVATAKQTRGLGGPTRGIWGVAYSPDGKLLASGGWDQTLRIYDVPTGIELRSIPDAVSRFIRGVSFSSDGRLLVAGGGGTTRLWDVNTGKEVPSNLPFWMCPTFMPGGKAVVGWSNEAGRISLCDVPPGDKREVWRAHADRIQGLAVSPDGRFIASVGSDGGKLWTVADQKEVGQLVGHRGAAYAASFTSDGRMLATAGLDDLTVRIWDLPPEFHVRP